MFPESKLKILSKFAVLFIVLTLSIPHFALGDISKNVIYLKSKTPNPWSVMALAASGESVDVDYLKNFSGASAISYEAPILALVAAGHDPSAFPNENFIAKLKSFYIDNQIGDPNLLNDDIFGILALSSASENNSSAIIQGAKSKIIAHQKTDGSFPFSVSSENGDTNTTAAAIMALIEAGLSKNDDPIKNAVSYLKNSQNEDGGFPYDPSSPWGRDSDASSNAWVISAINKIGETPSSWQKNGKSPIDHLSSLEDSSGFFKYMLGASEDSFSPVTTSYALIALLGKSLPVKKIPASTGPKISYRIEGSSNQICAGDTRAINALELVKIVSAECGFSYEIKDTSYGPYLSRIGADDASGMSGWMYTVDLKNLSEISVGAHDYILKEEESVLWFFGEWTNKLTRISTVGEPVSEPKEVIFKIESLEPNGWQPLESATVKNTGVVLGSTNQNGELTVFLKEGYHSIYGEKLGYVRSEIKKISIGGQKVLDIPLSVSLESDGLSGGGNGTTQSEIGFSVDTNLENTGADSSLNFGTLKKGGSSENNIKLTNSGSVPVIIQSIVSGDDIFRDNLKIESKKWRDFQSIFAKGESKNLKVSMSVPDNVSATGQKTGALTFWAVKEE